MFRGRETLTRLVGKRRCFLPNRQSLLSISMQESNDLSTNDDNKEILSVDKVDGFRDEEDDNGLVTCPVCGSKVSGDDYMINSHLDACLSRGTKRKLTQCTLLQLNFCSQSRAQNSSRELEKLGADVFSGGSRDSLVKSTTTGFANSGVDEKHSGSCKLASTADHVVQTGVDDSTEKPFNDDKANSQIDSTLLSLESEGFKSDVALTVDDIPGVTLETFIVGRRFSVGKELKLGTKISLLRDLDNAKDPNAIKVLSADSKYGEMLGFLPRELAQYLSPLIGKYSLTFEGCVTSLPKHPLDAVPVQIMCRKAISHSDNCHDELEDFRCLWKNVLHAVQSAKNHSPHMTRYQQNFYLLLREVLRSNSHLFTDDEKNFIGSFFSLSDDSQRLFVRLHLRKGPWFRMSNISYTEVMDLQQAIKGLSSIGFICSVEDTDELEGKNMKEILNMLTVSELREITCMLKNKKYFNFGTRKHDLVGSLFSLYEDGVCPFLQSAILDRTGTCIKISSKVESVVWRAERLFFLNGEQDLSAFLLADLGIVKYPTYNCIISEQIFSSRIDLLAYEEALEVAQMMDESLDESYSESVLRCIKIAESRICSFSAKAMQTTASEPLAAFYTRFSASWVYSVVVFLGISFFERQKRYNDAIKLLKQLLNWFVDDGRRGYWTLRLSIDLEHIGCPNESLLVAENGLLDPWVRAGSRMALQRRVLRLGKPPRRWKVPSFSASIKRKIKEVRIQGRPLACEIGAKSKFYGEDGEQCGVEQLALQYYAGEGGGWQGVHTESGIWLTVFGLLMWDILFSDVPNVFRNRFQTAPLDLETDSFYLARKNLIESQLQKIQDGMAEEILITSWELHSGTVCRGVNWNRHCLSELRATVTCVGGPCLASLCRHLAQDYQRWSSGMPDLFLWRFHGEHRGEAKLVEVKGPRDRLSEQQQAWLLLLMDCGFNIEVCKVTPDL